MSNFGRSTIITFDFDDLFVQFIVLSDVSAESPKENTNHSDGNRKYNEPECDIQIVGYAQSDVNSNNCPYYILQNYSLCIFNPNHIGYNGQTCNHEGEVAANNFLTAPEIDCVDVREMEMSRQVQHAKHSQFHELEDELTSQHHQ